MMISLISFLSSFSSGYSFSKAIFANSGPTFSIASLLKDSSMVSDSSIRIGYCSSLDFVEYESSQTFSCNCSIFGLI